MLTVILGPMFSGKSTELLRRLERARIAGRRAVLLRPERDTRDYLTHGKLPVPDIESVSLRGLSAFDPGAYSPRYEVIGVEEGQFLAGLVPNVLAWADAGYDVLVAGLPLSSERKPFRPILELMAEAEELVRLNAICTRCGSEHGAFSHYKPGYKTEEILIGGAELYDVLCRRCYLAATTGREQLIEGAE